MVYCDTPPLCGSTFPWSDWETLLTYSALEEDFRKFPSPLSLDILPPITEVNLLNSRGLDTINPRKDILCLFHKSFSESNLYELCSMASSWFIEIWREKLELICNACFNNSSTFSSTSDKKFLSLSSPNCLYGNPDSSSDDESDVRSNTSGFPLATLLIFWGKHSVGQICTISSKNFWLSSTKPMASFISAGLPILQLLRMHNSNIARATGWFWQVSKKLWNRRQTSDENLFYFFLLFSLESFAVSVSTYCSKGWHAL